MDRCLAEEVTDCAAFDGCRAGVRAASALSPAIMHGTAGARVCEIS